MRALRTIGLAILGLVLFAALTLAGLLALLATPAGQRMVLGLAKPAAEKALGLTLEIGASEGAWPFRIVLRDVRVGDADGPIASAERIAVALAPLSLLGTPHLREVTLAGAALERIPESAEESTGGPWRLPKLPKLRVDRFSAERLRISPAIVAEGTVLDVTAHARIEAARADIALDARTDGDRDSASLLLDWSGAGDRLAADLQLAGAKDGLLARLAALDRAFAVKIAGNGRASAWEGSLDARYGTAVSLAGELACRCAAPFSGRIDARAEAGPDADEEMRALIGDSARLVLGLEGTRDGLRIAVEKAEAPAGRGEALLVLTVEPKTGRLVRLVADATLEPADLAQAQEPLGPTLKAHIEASGTPKGFGAIRGLATSGSARLALSDGLYEEGALDAALELAIAPVAREGALGLLLEEGAQASAVLTLAPDGGLGLQDLAAGARGGALALSGTAAREAASGRLALDLKGSLAPGLLAELAPEAAFEEPVTLELAGSGPPVNFSGRLALALPSGAIAGARHGRGSFEARIAGALASPTVDLAGRLASPGEGDEGTLDGRLVVAEGAERVAGKLAVRYRRAALDADADLGLAPLAGHARLKLAADDLARFAPESSASGSVAAEARLDMADDKVRVDARATSPGFSAFGVAGRDVALTARGPLGALGFTLEAGALSDESGRGLTRLAAKGRLALEDEVALDLDAFDASLDGERVRLAAPAHARMGPSRLALDRLDLQVGKKGRLVATVAGEGESFSAEARLEALAIPPAGLLADGTLALATRGPGKVALKLRPLDPAAPDATLTLDGRLAKGRLALAGALAARREETRLDVPDLLQADLPLALSAENGRPRFAMEGEARIALAYRGEVAPLFAFSGLVDQALTGALTLDARLSGPIDGLLPRGGFTLAGGTYEHFPSGLRLTEVAATGTLEAEGGALDMALDLTASDGEGRDGARPVRARGTARLSDGALTFTARADLDKARLVRREDLVATLSGTATLEKSAEGTRLTGAIGIDAADYVIPQRVPDSVVALKIVRVNGGAQAAPPAAPAGPATALDLSIAAPERIFIRGRGIDSEWGADLRLLGTTADPRADGALTLKRGTIELGGRRFAIDRGRIAFSPLTPPDPRLDVAASTSTGDVTAIVSVTGRASAPAVNLSSEPQRPEGEVMSLILFGKPARELTAVEGLRAAQALAELTGTGPFGGTGVLDRVRRTLGVDTLDVDTSGDAPSLTVGRYVTEGVFVSASQDLTGGQSTVSVESKVTDHIRLKTDLARDASAAVSLNWSIDY
ncbi:MAG: translocation/assembly module TamB domain-containing protein [Alphaproteobacteria bacterium]|nr:translocation/assembly module TamB domain-containing protein [Alphaproteobacteria bacterium]